MLQCVNIVILYSRSICFIKVKVHNVPHTMCCVYVSTCKHFNILLYVFHGVENMPCVCLYIHVSTCKQLFFKKSFPSNVAMSIYVHSVTCSVSMLMNHIPCAMFVYVSSFCQNFVFFLL